EAAGPQQREQDPPTGPGVGHVMEHAAGVYDIEGSANASELENVGFTKGDIGQSQTQRLALGIAEARQAEIDRPHQSTFEVSRRLDQILPGPAAGNEDVGSVVSTQLGTRLEPVPEILRHGFRLAGPRRPPPSSVWVWPLFLLCPWRGGLGRG